MLGRMKAVPVRSRSASGQAAGHPLALGQRAGGSRRRASPVPVVGHYARLPAMESFSSLL